MDAKKRTEQLARLAPRLTDRELREINGLFRAYIFRRSRTGEVWTSCCGVHKIIQRCENDDQWRVMNQVHTPAPVYRWGRCVNEMDSGQRTTCPWCGAEAAVKELGRCGERKNLWEYRRAVVLRQWRGALWACAYDCFKGYGNGRLLTGSPRTVLLGVYRFAPGVAEEISKSWWDIGPLGRYRRQTAPGKRHRWEINAPYEYCAEYGAGYEAVGLDEVKRSAFRYCGVENLQRHCDLIRLLTACCFYADKIEWLGKCGLAQGVYDMVNRGVKNAAAIQWDAKTPREFLGITPRELQELHSLAYRDIDRLDTLGIWRRLRGTKAEDSLENCFRLADTSLDAGKLRQLVSRLKRWELRPGRLADYLDKLRGNRGLGDMLEEYLDYIRAAEGVGLDLRNGVFLLPRDLDRKHDQVTASWAAMQSKEKDREYRENRLRKLTRRYTYTDGTYLIRPPVNGAEIQREGKLLHHCVGGYADRHLKGATTILFLRRRDRPGRPLVTVEMRGNRIAQIHGWDDERTKHPDNPGRIDPRMLYRDFLDERTAWLEGGSKRDKRGQPVLPRRKRKESA